MTATKPFSRQAVMDRKFFGARLKKLREDAGLSQAELAKACNVDQKTISLLERGVHNPTWETVLSVCRVFKIKCAHFEPPEEKGRN